MGSPNPAALQYLDLTSCLNWKIKHGALRDKLADSSIIEKYASILKALPEHWKKRANDHEKNLRRRSFWVTICGITLTAGQVRNLLELHLPDDGYCKPVLGIVRVLSNSIEVKTKRAAHHKAILALNGRKFTSTERSFSLPVVEAKFWINPEQIFSLLRDELRLQEGDSALRSSVLQAGPSHKKDHAV